MAFPAWVVPAILSGASALGNALGGRAQGNALGRAGQINQQATNDAMAQILSLYDQGRQDLAPYRNVGQPALNRLQQMAGHPASSIGAKPQNALQRPPLRAQSAQNPFMDVMTQGKGPNSVGQSLSTTMGKGMAGFAAGGPIGAVAGALLGRRNPDKAAASRGVDELSRLTWGTNTPGIPTDQLTSGLIADVRQGRKAPAQGKAEFTQMWNSWVQGMKDAGVDDSIIRSSVETQRRNFQPVHDFFQGVV